MAGMKGNDWAWLTDDIHESGHGTDLFSDIKGQTTKFLNGRTGLLEVNPDFLAVEVVEHYLNAADAAEPGVVTGENQGTFVRTDGLVCKKSVPHLSSKLVGSLVNSNQE